MFVNKCVYNEIKKTAVYCLTHLPGKHSKMDYDAVLAEIGEFGAWQQGIIVLLWLPPMFAGIHNLLFVFTGNSVWATCLVKLSVFCFQDFHQKTDFAVRFLSVTQRNLNSLIFLILCFLWIIRVIQTTASSTNQDLLMKTTRHAVEQSLTPAQWWTALTIQSLPSVILNSRRHW